MQTLVERDGVLHDLDGHLQAADTGRGRLVLLGGEAGIGKTAVVRRFSELAAPRVRVLAGACDPLSTPRPLGPLADVAPGLGPSVEQALDGTHRPPEVFSRVLAALGRQATVVVFEDVHWADAATLDLLRYLGRRIETTSALLVATFRDDELGPAHPLTLTLGQLATCSAVHRCALAPLSRDGVATLTAGRSVDAEELYRITGGNPFFVTEVLSSGVDQVPATVHQAVTGRLAGLSAPARAVAEAVAVLAHPASPQLLADLVPGAEGALEEVLAGGVLRPDGPAVAFRHELARLAVLATVPGYRREAWHARVLAALCAHPVGAQELARLAFHAEQAQDAAAVLEYAPAAAAHAAALGAHREAAAHYARALRYGAGLLAEQRVVLLEGHAYECYLANQMPEAIASWQEAIALRRASGDRLREGDDLRWLSHVLWYVRGPSQARQIGLAAVEVLQELEPSLELAWAQANLARLTSLDYELASATAYAREAIDLGGRLGEPAVVLRARAQAAAARLYCLDEGWAELEQTWDEATEAGLAEQVGFIGTMACAIAVTHRDLDRADRFLGRLVPYCLDQDLMSFLVFARGIGALAMLHRGQWNQAVGAAAGALDEPGLPVVTRVRLLVALALARARRGEPEVWLLLDEAMRVGGPAARYPYALVWEARAEAAWLAGEDARAVAEAEGGLAALTPQTGPWLVGALACWIQRAGGTPAPVRATEPYARELAKDWHRAAACWERLGCPYDAALARLGGDVPAVREALSAFEALGAAPAAARARARLRALGVSQGTRGPQTASRAHPYRLTRREQEVVQLLAEGLSDAQIAARLHIAPKTASYHVAAILAKLGVHTRHQAVRTLAQVSGGQA